MVQFKAKKYKPVGDAEQALRIKAGRYRFYQTKYRGNFTRDEVERFGNHLSKKLKAASPKAGHFQISTLYESGMWRSGPMTKPGEAVSVFLEYDDMDLGAIKGFNIIVSLRA